MKYTVTSIRDVQMESLIKPTVSDDIVTILRLFKDMQPSTQHIVLESLREKHFQQILKSVEDR